MQSDDLKNWIGKTEQAEDTIAPQQVRRLAAVLDRAQSPQIGDPLPPLWHWAFFTPATRQSELGHDGHAELGQFLPPVSLPRRMWAGGRLRFYQPITIGAHLLQRSTILSLASKLGRTGPLIFVTVGHELLGEDGAVLLNEEHDIVYRDRPSPSEAAPRRKDAPADPEWRREMHPSSCLLFRYSALTFNSHRIHYDLPYAQAEGYPGLVVHGPLLATLLLELLHESMPTSNLAAFSYRAVAPLFNTSPFVLCGRRGAERGSIDLWAQTTDGALAMSATATVI